MKSNDFGQFIESKRLEKGYKSQRKFAEKTGISSATLSRIENNIQTPTPETLKTLSEHLNVGYADLLEKAEYFKGLSSDQKEHMKNFFTMHYELDNSIELLISTFEKEGLFTNENLMFLLKALETTTGVKLECSAEGFRKYLKEEDPDIEIKKDIINDLYNFSTQFKGTLGATNVAEERASYGTVPHNPSTMVRTPILGSIAAGQPINRIEHIEGYEFVSPELVRGREAFCLKVRGDSMSGDHIYDGDIVIAVVQNEVTSSDIAVVAINGDYATLKRVKCNENICMLIPSNPQMEPILVEAEQVKVIGKIIEVRRKLS